MKRKGQEKYSQTEKGKKAIKRAQEKYDSDNLEKRREQKREYMRSKREQDPSYGRWK
tara:strand:+ start:188 stop:358 length:171 start_codon:yes stop_codon:yes gene_type:complete